MTAAKAPLEDDQAFVLHTYPFRDTSVIVEAFTRRYGRLGVLAKGAKRPKSPLRAALLAFQPVAMAWSGRGELRTLTRAEWSGRQYALNGIAMICGYYLNELILKLLHRDDPHEALFDAYDSALAALAGGESTQAVLRRFEIALLREIGYALQLDCEAERGTPLVAEQRYAYLPERGPLRLGTGADAGTVELQGKTLLDMARGDFTDPLTAAESKLLMRWLIGHHLEQRTLNTRQLLLELQQL
ncbi:MAG: DNA repair protein RecO [Burkholderiales bacterium]|nr:DNA repair protein RecO [Burkholderiales bacterium]